MVLLSKEAEAVIETIHVGKQHYSPVDELTMRLLSPMHHVMTPPPRLRSTEFVLAGNLLMAKYYNNCP